MEDPIVSNFTVRNLHGTNKSYSVPIEHDRLVLVGENGTGKTTLITMMFYFLSGQFERLERFDFGEIEATIRGKAFHLKKSDLEDLAKYTPYFRRIRRELLSRGLETSSMSEAELLENAERLLPFFSTSLEPSSPRLPGNFPELKKLRHQVVKAVAARILFLPTYRRIEQDLKALFPGADVDALLRRRRDQAHPKNSAAYIELVEFGMSDVTENVQRSLTTLKDYMRSKLYQLMLTYLNEIITGSHKNVEQHSLSDLPPDVVASTVEHIDDTLVSRAQKKQLLEIVNRIRTTAIAGDDDRVIAHFFQKLLALHREQERREESINQFVTTCNNYLVGKQFVYDNIQFSLKVMTDSHARNPKEIELRHLSSGEKQIVSLFSHLLLTDSQPFYVLIDEPELSLSVAWQSRFLSNISSISVCAGLIAVTHSPFIFDNNLDKYARALTDFVEGGR